MRDGVTQSTSGRHFFMVLVPANLLGALVAFAYFTFLDPMAPIATEASLRGSIAFFIVGFSVLTAIVYVSISRWSRALEPVEGRPPTSADARRRALLLPYALAGITFCAWVMAGVLWGVVRPLLLGALTPER